MFVILCYRGYYPKGGGEVVVQMSPVKQLNPINLTDRGSVTKIHGRAFVAGVLPLKVSCLDVLGSATVSRSVLCPLHFEITEKTIFK